MSQSTTPNEDTLRIENDRFKKLLEKLYIWIIDLMMNPDAATKKLLSMEEEVRNVIYNPVEMKARVAEAKERILNARYSDDMERAQREMQDILDVAVQDSIRFEWYFNRTVDKSEFIATYLKGVQEKWDLDTWRKAIDLEIAKEEAKATTTT